MSAARPIIFDAESVKAILAGNKVQTRRIINRVQGVGPVTEFKPTDTPGYDYIMRDKRQLWNDFRLAELLQRCPHGQPGDRLWVRETFQIENAAEYGLEEADPPEGPVRIEDGGPEWGEIPLIPRYRATQPDTLLEMDCNAYGEPVMRWRPSIHMPRWASRILLEITDVRIERLQVISEADVAAEGVAPPFTREYKRPKFIARWDSINGKRPGADWASDPFVWVLTFRKVEASDAD